MAKGIQDFTLEIANRITGGRLQSLRTAEYPTAMATHTAAELALGRWLAVLPERELVIRVQEKAA